MSLQIEGLTLTSDGEEAMETIRGLFTDLDDEGLLGVLVGLVKEDPNLDYIRIERGGPSALVKCYCKRCKKDHFMSLGWLGHVQWIGTGLCSLCSRMVEAGK
ncbi:MAG: hypothetical protein WC479_09320 [Candidatus Izemoplasmatales bacterium]